MTEWRYDTHQGLVDAGYLFRGEDLCHHCGVRILLYKTPKDRLMHFDFLGGKLLPHYASCAQRHRRAKVLKFPGQRELQLEER